MKGNIEATMAALGNKMGVETVMETAHCLIALVGIVLAIVFCVMAITMHPASASSADTATSSTASQQVSVVL